MYSYVHAYVHTLLWIGNDFCGKQYLLVIFFRPAALSLPLAVNSCSLTWARLRVNASAWLNVLSRLPVT